MEVYVKSPSGTRGFLDLYDASLNQYYEVKHINYSPIATEAQMLVYDQSSIKSWMFAGYTIVDSPTRGMNMSIHGSFMYKSYSVNYFFVAPGLIHYTIDLVIKQQPSTVAVLVPQAEEKPVYALAGCVVAYGGGGGSPCWMLGKDVSREFSYAY